MSRIDFWLVTQKMLNYTSQTSISAAPATNHLAVSITLTSKKDFTCRQTYWKFITNLLKDDQYCNMVKKILSDVKTNRESTSKGNKWEFF